VRRKAPTIRAADIRDRVLNGLAAACLFTGFEPRQFVTCTVGGEIHVELEDPSGERHRIRVDARRAASPEAAGALVVEAAYRYLTALQHGGC
jgi:hypothetical protein